MLVSAPDIMLGTSASVKITSVGRWSVFGEVIDGSVVVGEAPKQTSSEPQKQHIQNQVEEAGRCATDSCGACACSDVAQHCSPERCEDIPDAPQTSGNVNHQGAVQSTLVRRNVDWTAP